MKKLYDYSPIPERQKLNLPNDARLAFWVGLNIEYYELGKPSTSIFNGTAHLSPDPLNSGWRDYGPRVGLWRIADALDSRGLRASVLLNSDACSNYPQIITEGNKRDWGWVAHGKNNSIFQTDMPLEEEQRYLGDVVNTIEFATGKRPKGWLGPALTETTNTPRILAELGLSYILDWCCDDQPFSLNVEGSRMISVPYSIEVNDIPLFVGKSLDGNSFLQIVKDQFDRLYDEGQKNPRVMALAIHPFIIGQPFRIRYLEEALDYITKHKDVWLTTSDDISDWYHKNCIDEH